MDIHKPKAAHSWRDFLTEIGTIICGILIALGLEQVVTFFHHRASEAEARAAIEGELGRNIGNLRLRARQQQGCITARIADLQSRLDEYFDGKPWRQPHWIGKTQFWTMEDTRWQAISKGGLAALLPANEIEKYSFAQSRISMVQSEEMIEQADWAELRAMENIKRPNFELAARFQVVLRDVGYRVFRVKVLTSQLQEEAKRIGIEVVESRDPQTNSICFPTETPRDEALRMSLASGSKYGEP